MINKRFILIDTKKSDSSILACRNWSDSSIQVCQKWSDSGFQGYRNGATPGFWLTRNGATPGFWLARNGATPGFWLETITRNFQFFSIFSLIFDLYKKPIYIRLVSESPFTTYVKTVLNDRSEERKNSDLYSNVEEVVTEEVTTSKKTEYVPEAVNSTNVFNDESPGAEEVTTPKKAECVSDIESRKAILNEVDVHTNTEKVKVEEYAPCSTAEKEEVQDSLDRIDAEIKNQNEKVTPRSIESQDRAPPLPAANVGPSLAPYDQNLSAIANLQNLTMSLELLQSRSFCSTNLS